MSFFVKFLITNVYLLFFQLILLASLLIQQKKLLSHSFNSMGRQSGQARNFAHPVPTPTVDRWAKQNKPVA